MKEKSYESSTLLVPELADVLAAKDLGEDYTVDDWPWGRKQLCSMRFFVETTKRGQRFVKQSTMNERTYKPKKSTYCDRVKIILIDDRIGHISWNNNYKHFGVDIEDGKYASVTFFDDEGVTLSKHFDLA
jgi:hypothetical protein